MSERELALGGVLSVVTGKVISDQGMEGWTDILEFMVGEPRQGDLWTLYHTPRCASSLKSQYPWLENVSLPDGFSGDEIYDWLAVQELIHGETLRIAPLVSGYKPEVANR